MRRKPWGVVPSFRVLLGLDLGRRLGWGRWRRWWAALAQAVALVHGASCAAAGASSPSSVSSSAGLAGASSSSSEELKPAVGGAHFRRAVPAPTRRRWTSRPRWAGPAGSASRPAQASSQASRGLAGVASARAAASLVARRPRVGAWESGQTSPFRRPLAW